MGMLPTEGLARYREPGNMQGMASVLHSLGEVRCMRGDLEAATAHLEEGLAHNRSR
jgi:hypothetical protein